MCTSYLPAYCIRDLPETPMVYVLGTTEDVSKSVLHANFHTRTSTLCGNESAVTGLLPCPCRRCSVTPMRRYFQRPRIWNRPLLKWRCMWSVFLSFLTIRSITASRTHSAYRTYGRRHYLFLVRLSVHIFFSSQTY